MKCLVTGAAGFVGSTLCDKLLSLGHQVVGVDCFLEYYPRKIKELNLLLAKANSNFTFIEADILSLDLRQLLAGCEWVFHQAAQAGVRASWGQYFKTYSDNNVLATQRLLDACMTQPQIKRIIYASSSSVYGNAESFPTSESALPMPVSPYGVTKLAAEHLMVLYASEFGLPTAALRYFTVYGPRQRPDMAFNRFSSAALRGEEITIFGDGEQSRDFTFVDDIVAANILAAEKAQPGAVYNLGGGSVVTVNQVLDILRAHVGTLKVKYEGRQVGDASHTSADITRAKRELGFAPEVSLVEGLRREVQWMESLLR